MQRDRPMPEVTIKAWQCARCGNQWVSRKGKGKPKTCPACRSPYWDTPVQHPEMSKAAKKRWKK